MRRGSAVQRIMSWLCQRLTQWLARKPYRPELHYMRGPGPKWYAKHQRRTTDAAYSRVSTPIVSP